GESGGGAPSICVFMRHKLVLGGPKNRRLTCCGVGAKATALAEPACWHYLKSAHTTTHRQGATSVGPEHDRNTRPGVYRRLCAFPAVHHAGQTHGRGAP